MLNHYDPSLGAMKNQLTGSATALQLHAIPAFNDNYIWLLHNGQSAAVVDPGDANPVLQTLKKLNLDLCAILVTHHHHDHVGGIADLVATFPQAVVYGPAQESIPHRQHALAEGDEVDLDPLAIRLQVLDIPGHTAGHIAYFGHNSPEAPILFCGDTLFSGGCGRLFEGTPAQMLESLEKLSALPANTLVCAAHEYTLSNLVWALDVEPDNPQLHDYYQQAGDLRAANTPTLPSILARELQINPFLRTHIPTVQLNAAKQSGRKAHNRIDVFAQLREWKNNA